MGIFCFLTNRYREAIRKQISILPPDCKMAVFAELEMRKNTNALAREHEYDGLLYHNGKELVFIHGMTNEEKLRIPLAGLHMAHKKYDELIFETTEYQYELDDFKSIKKALPDDLLPFDAIEIYHRSPDRLAALTSSLTNNGALIDRQV